MATSGRATTRNVIIAFIAGFLAVLVFHQVMSSLINGRMQWNMGPASAAAFGAFGLPQVVNQAFWGGVWGIVFAWMAPKFPKGPLWWVASIAFGAILLPLVSWYVVPALKGLPLGPRNAMNSMLINGAWGLGMGVFWKLFNRAA